jgi:hypothetical protein
MWGNSVGWAWSWSPPANQCYGYTWPPSFTCDFDVTIQRPTTLGKILVFLVYGLSWLLVQMLINNRWLSPVYESVVILSVYLRLHLKFGLKQQTWSSLGHLESLASRVKASTPRTSMRPFPSGKEGVVFEPGAMWLVPVMIFLSPLQFQALAQE